MSAAACGLPFNAGWFRIDVSSAVYCWFSPACWVWSDFIHGIRTWLLKSCNASGETFWNWDASAWLDAGSGDAVVVAADAAVFPADDGADDDGPVTFPPRFCVGVAIAGCGADENGFWL